MLDATPAFASAVEAPDQMIGYSLILTLPSGIQASFGDLSECVESANWYPQVTSSLPDNVSLVAGYSAVQLEVGLSGLLSQGDGVAKIEGQDAYWLCNPNDPTSPMYRQTTGGLPIVFKIGLYDGDSAPELLFAFTGTTDDIVCSDGVATIICLDNRNTITNAAVLPPVVTAPPENSQLTSEFVIDYLPRHSSPGQYYSWPGPHPDCKFACGFRSSIWPEVGRLYPGFVQQPVFGAGLYGTGLQSAAHLIVYETDTPFLTTDKICLHMLNQGGDFAVNINDDPNTYQVVFQRVFNTLFIYTESPSGGISQSWTIDPGPHEFEYSVGWAAGSTSVTGTVWVDGSPNAVSFTAKDARPTGRSFTITAMAGNLEGVQFTNEPSYATYYPFDRTLILDPGQSLNALTALPDVSGKDAWSVLQEIATVEAAVIWFDGSGLLNFTNRQTIRSALSVRTITSAQALKTLDSHVQKSACRTHIQVPVNQLQIEAPATVWSASSSINIPGYSSTTFLAQTSTPVVNVPATDSGFMPTSPTPGLTYWRADALPDGSAFGTATGITVDVEQLSGSSLSITVTNSNPFPVWLVNPTGWPGTEGSPCLVIGGQAVTSTQTAPDGSNAGGTIYADAQWPPIGSGGALANKTFGAALLSVAASDWLQDLGSAQSLAADLLKELHYPKPQYQNISIVPDPRLQILDRITLQDPDLSQINDDVLITGIDFQISNGTYTQTIDARAFFRPGAWILGLVGRSELGSTTWIF